MPPKILIAIPAYGGTVQVETMVSITGLCVALERAGIAFRLVTDDRASIVRSRNILASVFLEDPSCTHLQFVDADLGFRPQAIQRMLEVNAPIVGCVYAARTLDPAKFAAAARSLPAASALAVASKFAVRPGNGREANAIMEVEGLCTGLMLIRRDALKDLIGSVKVQDKHDGSCGLKGPIYRFFDEFDDDSGMPLSEDYAFCTRYTRTTGRPVMAITDEWVKHVGRMVYGARLIDLPAATGVSAGSEARE